MVSYKTLIQVIDDNVNKCSDNKIPSSPNSWGVRLGEDVRKAIELFEDETCGDKPLSKEKICLVNDDGEVVYSKYGNSHSVSYNEDRVYKVRNENGMLHNIHNHPNVKGEDLPTGIIPTMLSRADVYRLTDSRAFDNGRFGYNNWFDYIFKSITATSPNGSRITLMKNDNFTPSDEEAMLNTYDKMEVLWQNYCNNFHTEKQHQLSYFSSETDDGWFHQKYNLKGKSYDECIDIIDKIVVKEIGSFEDELKPIRKEFNDCNCELSIEWRK